MVFQNYALYPHMTVYQNIGLSLEIHKVKKDELNRRVQEAADVLHLEELLHKRPRELSGGQRQRRDGSAIVREPRRPDGRAPLEPDAAHVQMRGRSSGSEGAPCHDRLRDARSDGAMTLGDHVAVMKRGVLQQVASPQELYAHDPSTCSSPVSSGRRR